MSAKYFAAIQQGAAEAVQTALDDLKSQQAGARRPEGRLNLNALGDDTWLEQFR
jgi:hypothetical protein